MIDFGFYRRKLFSVLNRRFDFISTIDHPFASPPVRIMDGHRRMLEFSHANKFKPLILVWDTNIPLKEKHRSELIFDIGLINLQKEFYIFNSGDLYPLQIPKKIDLYRLEYVIDCFFEKNVIYINKKYRAEMERKFKGNFKVLLNVYKELIDSSIDGTEFYIDLINKIYSLLNLYDLKNFFNTYYLSYFKSDFISHWISFCISRTVDKYYGFLNLLDKDVFKKPYFRFSKYSLNDSCGDLCMLNDRDYIRNNIDKIITLLQKSIIIPSSYEIFFWAIYIANIKHYGNDYGFMNKLDSFFGMNNNIQLTTHNKDSVNIIKHRDYISYNYIANGDRIKFRIVKNNKESKINTITSFICNVGVERFKEACYKYLGKNNHFHIPSFFNNQTSG